MRLVSIFRNKKMKKASLLKISLLVKIVGWI